MKKIKLLRRTNVSRVGVCEAESVTVCRDDVAAHLVNSELAEYATAEDKKAAAAEAKKAAA